jgi:hypothetical protein
LEDGRTDDPVGTILDRLPDLAKTWGSGFQIVLAEVAVVEF